MKIAPALSAALALVLALVLLTAWPALTTAWAAPPSPTVQVRTDLSAVGEADLSGGGKGGLSVVTGRVEAAYEGFSLHYQESRYQWSEVGRLPFGNGRDDPWDSLKQVGVGYTRQGKINEEWGYQVRAGLSNGFEQQMSDSYQATVMALASYRISSAWRVSLGLRGQYHLVRSSLLPALMVSYNLENPRGPFFSLGFPRTVAGYRFNPVWSLNWGMLEFNRNYYQLADDSAVRRGGYLQTSDLMSSAWVAFSPGKDLKLEAGLRYLFKRELLTYDSDGENERGQDLDNTWGAFLRLSLEF